MFTKIKKRYVLLITSIGYGIQLDGPFIVVISGFDSKTLTLFRQYTWDITSFQKAYAPSEQGKIIHYNIRMEKRLQIGKQNELQWE